MSRAGLSGALSESQRGGGAFSACPSLSALRSGPSAVPTTWRRPTGSSQARRIPSSKGPAG